MASRLCRSIAGVMNEHPPTVTTAKDLQLAGWTDERMVERTWSFVVATSVWQRQHSASTGSTTAGCLPLSSAPITRCVQASAMSTSSFIASGGGSGGGVSTPKTYNDYFNFVFAADDVVVDTRGEQQFSIPFGSESIIYGNFVVETHTVDWKAEQCHIIWYEINRKHKTVVCSCTMLFNMLPTLEGWRDEYSSGSVSNYFVDKYLSRHARKASCYLNMRTGHMLVVFYITWIHSMQYYYHESSSYGKRSIENIPILKMKPNLYQTFHNNCWSSTIFRTILTM